METLTLLVVAILLTLFLLLFYVLYRKLAHLLTAEKDKDSVALLSQWLSDIRGGLDRHSELLNQQLARSNDSINQRLDTTAHLLRLLNKDLGLVHEVGQQMRDFQHFFRSPKVRGKLGEQIMNEILLQVLPRSSIKFQYRFNTGYTVDALIILENGKLAVDAKFPMENYHKALQAPKEDLAAVYKKDFFRDVKKHIASVGSKYIVPAEGTLDFAVMYVPSETLYYEIINNNALMRESEQKKVLIVSPNTFFYFLRLLLMGLYSYKLEKTAARILQRMNALRTLSSDVSKELQTLVLHINNTKNASDRLSNRFLDMERKIEELMYLNKDNVEEDQV